MDNSNKSSKIVKKADNINQNTKQNNKKNAKPKKKSKVKKVIFIIIISIILLCIIGSGVVIGIFWTNYKDEMFISKEDLVIPYENSTVYDIEGNLVATLSGGTKRKCISLSEMGEYLPKAYVAIEDERFYDHKGVDVKRTGAATITYLTHGGESSFGGSTITQQLVKNITNDKEDSAFAGVVRKVKEMAKAYQVEQLLSKDQILELYLNLIFIGGNDINGVELGARYYFNKEPAELSLAECAFMAGINNSPNSYKPFSDEEKHKETIKKRTKTVLNKMKELGYIKNEEDYKNAIAEVENGLNFQKGENTSTTEVTYLVEAALDQIMEQLVEEKNMSKSMAETYLYSGGLRIYTTQNTNIQNKVEEVVCQDKYYTNGSYTDNEGTKINEESLPTMVVLDHTKGYVVAAATAAGEKGARIAKTRIGYLNYPTALRKQTGSSMKPIAVIAPGLETKTITAATVYYDEKTTFGTNYTPKNYYAGFKGPMNMRTAIEISANIPHVKALSDIGMEASINFCESVGMPRFEKEGLSLALGGLSEGVTVTEMAGAYGTIANDGLYIQPTFYQYVKDGSDNIILEPNQKTNQSMTVQNAFIEKSILTEPVVGSSGTAKYCAVPGMSTAAKTGTTNDDYDRWLCGFTPYYTAVCWYGYKINAPVVYSGNPAGKIWEEVMKSIHTDLPNAEFVKPEGIVEVSVCKDTGLKASGECGNVYKEYFTEDTVPEACSGHQMLMTCTETDLLCSEGCPFGEWRAYGGVAPNEQNASWSTVESNSSNAPTDYCPHGFGSAPASAPVTTPVVDSTPASAPVTTPTHETNNIPSSTTPTENTTPSSSSGGGGSVPVGDDPNSGDNSGSTEVNPAPPAVINAITEQ